MRCKICDHVLVEKDGSQHHKLKYWDSLHQPQIQGENAGLSGIISCEDLALKNLTTAFNAIKENSSQQIPDADVLIKKDNAVIVQTEILGSNDEMSPVERMKMVSKALENYFGGKNWIEIRNAKQPGLGK